MKQAVALGLLALASFVGAQTSVSLVPTKTGWGDNYGVSAPLFYSYDTASSWWSANATGGYTNSNNSNLSLEYVFTISLPLSSSVNAPTSSGSFSHSLSAPLATRERGKTRGSCWD